MKYPLQGPGTALKTQMTEKAEAIRLYVSAPLATGGLIMLDPQQSHYLRNVMRRKVGDSIGLFNGRDGEWRAEIVEAGKKATSCTVSEQTQAQWENPDLWLLFAPLKRGKIDYLAARATELGVRALQPVFTAHTNATRINLARLEANAIEAAEQCRLVSVPEIRAPEKLDSLLDRWPADRHILFCDESGNSPPIAQALAPFRHDDTGTSTPWAILIGPEGGFSAAEQQRLRTLDCAIPVSLGPRIMRAETAAIAALSVWQALLGDWHIAGKFAPINTIL